MVSGATGLVGTALVESLRAKNHDVVRLVRKRQETDEPQIVWDPAGRSIDLESLEGFDAVVHLSGENVGAGRWTEAKKQRIRDSRIHSTTFLCETIAGLNRPPSVLLCASAIGYYGDRGEEVLTEESPPGEGFLAEVCREWEAATGPAKQHGIRVVNLRLGVVLAANGGALAKMLTPFKLGLGGVVGGGRQYMSWVTLEDVTAAIFHLLNDSALSGPVNLTSPNAVTNRAFAKALAKALHRPALFPMPAFAARLAFGEMADALLLASTNAKPKRLLDTGFTFKYGDVDGALAHLLIPAAE